MATDEQPMALQEFFETRQSRKTCANSKTSTATKVDLGELASLPAEFPWAEEYSRARAIHERRPQCPSRQMSELDQVVVVGTGRRSRPAGPLVNSSCVTVEMISRFPSAPKRGQLFFEVLTTTESSRRQRKAFGQLSSEEVRLRESASTRFGMDVQNALDVLPLRHAGRRGILMFRCAPCVLPPRSRLGDLVVSASQRQC